jgi:peptidoglycan/xylan/chitin deacetylase (PgdA/CDA1 family)
MLGKLTEMRTALLVTALFLLVPAASWAGGGVLRLPDPLPSRTIDLPILMYHRIGPIPAGIPAVTKTLTVTPEDFAGQMRWLKSNGYHAVSQLQVYRALEKGKPLPAKPVMITFDDGYRDVLWHAAPVLHRLHMPATEYVITGRVSNGDPSFLTWPQLTRLEKLGVTIGSHTVTHQDLALIPPSQALAELRDSRRALEQHLGHPVQWFAYPFGAENATVVSLAERVGYVLAVTTQGGTAQSAAAPLLLHREEVTDTTGPGGLVGLVG